MSIEAFFLISASILMHSLWHFLCKSSGKPSMAFFALFSSSLFLTMLPFALCSGLLGEITFDVAKFAILGGLSGVICDVGLILAYRHCDISLAYPMARALPVFLTMLISVLFHFGNSLSWLAIAGMIIIFSGCLLMVFSNQKDESSLKEKLEHLKKGVLGICIAACGTTAYTFFDKYGIDAIMKLSPETNKLLTAGTYSCIRESMAMTGMWVTVCGLTLCGKEKNVLRTMAKQYHPYLAGVLAALAYVLILLAMNYVSNVSFVQAFRQLSLPISALLGFFILKEKITKFRWLALALIMLGLVLSVLK
ncbi:MAG: EamA family transporter [Lentisphaeria bacterium]|nr:EamA family transporter [Lentisphaeria bacterium]